MIATRKEVEEGQHEIIGVGVRKEVEDWAEEMGKVSVDRCYASYSPATDLTDEEVLLINFKEAILFSLRVGINVGIASEKELQKWIREYNKT